MKLLLLRRTAIVGITSVVEVAEGGSMTGADTVMAEEELGAVDSVSSEEVFIVAAATGDRGSGGGRRSR